MTHQLLLNADRGTDCVEPRPIGVAESVPSCLSARLVRLGRALVCPLGSSLCTDEGLTREYLYHFQDLDMWRPSK
jgi:hypothetical protein